MKTYPPRELALIAFALAGLLFSGCQNMRHPVKAPSIPASFAPSPVANTAPLDPGLLQRPNAEYRLGPGDVLQIEIIGDLTTRARSVVGPDGKIYFNVLPGVDVWGLTIAQARERLVQEMQKFIREPQPVAM